MSGNALLFFIDIEATNMFVKVMHSHDQKYLFAYPIALLYACFALIVMF